MAVGADCRVALGGMAVDVVLIGNSPDQAHRQRVRALIALANSPASVVRAGSRRVQFSRARLPRARSLIALAHLRACPLRIAEHSKPGHAPNKQSLPSHFTCPPLPARFCGSLLRAWPAPRLWMDPVLLFCCILRLYISHFFAREPFAAPAGPRLAGLLHRVSQPLSTKWGRMK